MYTELILGCDLKKDTPSEVIDTILLLIGEAVKTKPLIEFKRNPLNGSSYYFGVSESLTFFKRDELTKRWILSVRANIKNYDSDIEKFLAWIKPYVYSGSGGLDTYALVMYEEDLYYKHYNLYEV